MRRETRTCTNSDVKCNIASKYCLEFHTKYSAFYESEEIYKYRPNLPPTSPKCRRKISSEYYNIVLYSGDEQFRQEKIFYFKWARDLRLIYIYISITHRLSLTGTVLVFKVPRFFALYFKRNYFTP